MTKAYTKLITIDKKFTNEFNMIQELNKLYRIANMDISTVPKKFNMIASAQQYPLCCFRGLPYPLPSKKWGNVDVINCGSLLKTQSRPDQLSACTLDIRYRYRGNQPRAYPIKEQD